MTISRIFRTSLVYISCSILSTHALASGFRLESQSVSVAGDAGDAAVIDDASTNWYNSAGLVYTPTQLVVGGMAVMNNIQFAGNSTAPGAFLSNYSSSGVANSNQTFFIPGFHYSQFINPNMSAGLSVVPIWGLAVNYGEGSLVRYNLTRVYSRTSDIEPSLAFKLNNQWSIGLGPDFYYWTIQTKSHARTQILTPNDSITRSSIEDWATGFHTGLLFRPSDCTRIGLNYRSKVVMHMEGYSSFASTGLGAYETNNLQVSIPLPPTTTLSVYQDITPRWAMMGTVAYDQWNVLKNINSINVQSVGFIIPNVLQPQHMRNTVDVAIGTHYKINETWLLRGNIKYENTPTINQYRDVAFPDSPHLNLGVGAHYQAYKKVGFDFLYGHIFNKTVAINALNTSSLASSIGHSRASSDVFGAQVVWDV